MWAYVCHLSVFSLSEAIPVHWDCCLEGHSLLSPWMTLMYIQEDKILHIRGIDTCKNHSVVVTTYRNVNIDFKGKLHRICDFFPWAFCDWIPELQKKTQNFGHFNLTENFPACSTETFPGCFCGCLSCWCSLRQNTHFLPDRPIFFTQVIKYDTRGRPVNVIQ